MNIFVIAEGEALPLVNGTGRLMRAGMIAQKLSQRGNDVTWWSSTFLHYEKRYFRQEDTEIHVGDNLTLRLLHSRFGYKKNISIKRIRYSKELGKKLNNAIKKESVPDVIYCSWPLIDLSYVCVTYGKEHNIPVVIDIRDMWPDIFIQPFPPVLQPIVKFGVNIVYGKKVSYVMKHASAITGVIPYCMEFAEFHGRSLRDVDHVVYLAYDTSPVTETERIHAENYWKSLGIEKGKFIVTYIGSIGNRIGDFDTVVEAAKKSTDPNILFVICGSGSYSEGLREATAGCANIILPGYKNKAEIQTLLNIASIGLLPYRNTFDFINAIPNKFAEYLSGGLILLSSLRGASRVLLEKYRCGFYYDSADALLAHINQLKSDDSLRFEMSRNAKALFSSDFDASVVYTQFCQFLESLATGSDTPSAKVLHHE